MYIRVCLSFGALGLAAFPLLTLEPGRLSEVAPQMVAVFGMIGLGAALLCLILVYVFDPLFKKGD